MEVCVQKREEAAMIAAVLAGDTQLYHELIRPHERRVYRMALSYMKNEHDAEDVAQDAFIKAFRSLSAFRGESTFCTWLISITLNEARYQLRRRATVRLDFLDETQYEVGPVPPAVLCDWRDIPSEAFERKEVRKLLQRAIEALPEIYRQVVLLRNVEELSVNETAQILNIGISSVKVRLHRARFMLQRRLAPQIERVTYAPKKRRHHSHRV